MRDLVKDLVSVSVMSTCSVRDLVKDLVSVSVMSTCSVRDLVKVAAVES